MIYICCYLFVSPILTFGVLLIAKPFGTICNQHENINKVVWNESYRNGRPAKIRRKTTFYPEPEIFN